ncbi:MAG: polysaccharide biosynthesis C-terminal domain-containing protein [Lachnospiraceae bacterium]|nr:polysaccharide biosynthesis C-terminal domain-containing protein [Lachnospiraceae bacterium]
MSTLYQVLHLVTPLITAPYIARVLHSDGVGIYSYTNSYQMYFSMFAALGTVSYGTREISRNRENKAMYSKLFWEIECLTVLTTMISLIAWGTLILANSKYRLCFIALTPSILAIMFDISWLYIGLEKFVYTVSVNSLAKILSILALFTFVKKETDVLVYIFILSVTVMIGNATMWLFLPKTVDKISFKNFEIKRHFKETLIYFIPTIATSIYTVLDKTLIGAITSDNNENGYYEQATKIVNMAKAVTFTSLNSVLGSRISFLYKEKKYTEIKQRIGMSIDYILFMGIGICAGIIAIADTFIPFFFGKGYEGSISMLRLLSPVIIIIGISNCLGSHYYTPSGRRSKSAKYIVTGSIVNLILNIILIPMFRGNGAVIATILAEGTISFLYFANCEKIIDCKILFSKIWKKFAAAIVMWGVLVFINDMRMNALAKVACELFIGGSVYIVILILIKDSFVGYVANKFIVKIKKATKEGK